ncbi:hypothetical protein RUM44_013132 [Polyplax serrata]|uniref:Nuclear pore complex protein Nup214 n=1 Tax=Polyplax serrata TaxID=468196 RepID=A0ABR1BGY5_POLSC
MAQLPTVLQGPEPVETAELHFKLQCKLKIFEPTTKFSSGYYNLIAVSQHYGLIFVGTLNGFSVIPTKLLKTTISFNEFARKDVALNSKVTHISVDFTQKFLAVVCNSQSGAVLYVYNISSLASKDMAPVKVLELSKIIQNLTAEVRELMWQPNADGLLMICMSEGSVLSFNPSQKDGSLNKLNSDIQAQCLCWSPKGKQIIVGCSNGTLSQYKPDLKIVKTIPAPPLFNGGVSVVNILWISNYQFAVAYIEKNNPSAFPVITIVNAVKNEPVNVINFDDVTYSSALSRQPQMYMSHQSAWNLIFIGSANGIEVAVLNFKNGATWEQWLLGDASRAELPLNAARQETFPLGMAYDITAVDNIPWGEGALPPMPRLLLLSDEGVLSIFNIVNTAANATRLCGPPKEHLNDNIFVTKSPTTAPSLAATVVAPNMDQQKLQPTSQPFSIQSNSGNTKPMIGGFPVQQTPTTRPPEVTISIAGGGVIGGIKDISSLLQQRQQPQQTQPTQQIHFQQVQPQPLQEGINLTSQNLTAASSQNLLQKFSKSMPQVASTATPVFSFGTPLATSPMGLKPAVTQSTTGFSVGLPVQGLPQIKTSTTQPKIQPTSTPQVDVFAGKTNIQESTPIKAAEPMGKPVTTKTNSLKEKAPESKTEEISGSFKTSSGSNSPGLPELPAVDDSVYWNALHDEIEHFNSELQLLSTRVSSLEYEVGKQDEKISLRKRLDELNEFCKEVKNTTSIQSCEIHSVVTDLMESFGWLEDAKSRNIQRKNPSFVELKRSEELDPISERHMKEIGQLKYYIENQLQQLTSHLEKEWMDHQDNYRMEVKNQMVVPTLEELYKTMHFQLKILSKQRSLVEELKTKLMTKKRKSKSLSAFTEDSPLILPPPQESSRISELSKLADKILHLKINREDQNSSVENWEIMKNQIKARGDRSKKLTSEKQAALRDILSERDMVRIRPVKTTIESSSFLRSMALQKSTQKAIANKNDAKLKEKEKTKLPSSPTKSKTALSPKPKGESKPKPKSEKVENKEKVEVVKKPETPGMFIFGSAPVVQKTVPEEKVKSPVASSTVTGLAKKSENQIKFPEPSQPLKPFISAGSTSTLFGSIENKEEKKAEEPKGLQMFTFGASKPVENIFGKTQPASVFGGGISIFGSGLTSSVPPVTKSDTLPKSGTNTTISTTTAQSPAFSFTASSSTFDNTPELPKMNLLFTPKTQSSGLGTTTTAQSIFSSGTTLTSSTPLFGTNIFGSSKPLTTSASSQTPTQPSVPRSVESKPVEATEISIVLKTPESKNEEVDVMTTETLTPSTQTAAVSAQAVSTVQSSPAAATTITFGKPPSTTLTFDSAAPIFGPPSTTTSSAAASFSFASAGTPPLFETSTTTTTTVTTPVTTTTTVTGAITTSTPAVTSSNLFLQSPVPTTQVDKVSSTTPTTNIFGGATSPTNVFGSSTPTSKPIFGQATSPSTPSSGNIFGNANLTPTTNTFGQSSSSAAAFAESVSQTANIFGQLLSESNQSTNLFPTSSATSTTTTNIFSTPKNIFGGGGGTQTTQATASLFGSSSNSSPIFGQSTTPFGQSNTSANVFGQTTSNSFFGQNICSPFGGSSGTAAATSNQSTFGSASFGGKPVFGQNLFGQSSNSTSVFGGSPSSSIFGGATSPSAGTNAFQTTTTTFGSTSPGPFSSSQGSVAETGFKAEGGFQKSLGVFGSPPIFGGGLSSTPAFGASPTFSGAATFGSQPTFGSPQVGFSQLQGSTTFENLASQNTVGFGNLAQQSQSQGFGGFTSTPAFDNKPSFG